MNEVALRRRFQPAQRPGRDGRLLAIASGKGGVGKTLLATTLAHAFARGGQKTLLFDGDLGLANVDIQLGLAPARDLSDVLGGRVALADALMRAPVADAPLLDIVAGASGSGNLAALAPARLEALLDDLVTLAGGYRVAVLDLAAGLERSMRAIAARADTVLIVTTGDPTALTDAYACLKVLALRDPGIDARIVVNHVVGRDEGQRVYDTLLRAAQNFLKLSPPLAAIVRTDRHVADAIRAQAPLLVRHPNTEAARDLERLAAVLATEARP
ncbi:MAG: AAA family ATPase [Alphaproteobacteria bacterium]